MFYWKWTWAKPQSHSLDGQDHGIRALNENCRGLCQTLQRSSSFCSSDWYLKNAKMVQDGNCRELWMRINIASVENLSGEGEKWLWALHSTSCAGVGQDGEVQDKRAASNSADWLQFLQSGGERIQSSTAQWTCVRSLPADTPVILLTLPPAPVSFPRGENNLFPILYHSCSIRFQVLKGTNCFIPCISVACRRGRNYSWLEFLGSTLIQRCWNSSPGFRQNSRVWVCLLLCCALGHKLQ